MSKKYYVLQKDLPNVPKGAIFEENAFGNYNCIGLPTVMYNAEDVEDNTTWFKSMEETILKYTDDDMRKCFNAARMPVNKADLRPIYFRYEDYKNSLQQ